MDSNFARLPAVVEEGRRVVNNLQRTASLFVTKTIFAFVITLIFTLASIVGRNPSIHYPFVTNHLYLWEIFTSGFAAFFIALEKNSERIEGRFLSNVFRKAIPAASLLITSVLLVFLLYTMQGNNIINFGIYTKGCAIAMSVLIFSVLGLVCLYKVCSPLDKYRTIVLLGTVVVNAALIVMTLIITFAIDKTESLLQIPYLEMSAPAVFTTIIITVVFAAIYLFAYYLVNIMKGKDVQDED